jgi:cellulose biosynthesis protein BcsQ
MYVVTFYSFKGGVGRTMALVNVGVELARSGRRVLMVDFDLEAPGLDTFNLPRPQSETAGLVDYVSRYWETGTAPDLIEYFYESPGVGAEGGRLWIMPSGRHDHFYGARLNCIDWQQLYAEREGYLLFENLKAAWKRVLDPDYVLIDSRTGHTDVGGICTRQLPDAVTILFFPNEQNRRGLEKVVKEIRQEASEPRKKRIELHFVMSNVPDLDDEDRILAGSVQRLKETLGYDDLAGTIHHYNSLALLNQVIFTWERPRSRLSEQYRGLARAILRRNTADREGALAFVTEIMRPPSRMRQDLSASSLEEKVQDIQTKHTTDGEIQWRLAQLRRRQGRLQEAIARLDQAMKCGRQDSEVLLARAEMHSLLNDAPAALADVKRFLDSTDGTYFDVNLAIGLLQKLDTETLRQIPTSRALSALAAHERIQIANDLLSNRAWLPTAESILRSVLHMENPSPEEREAVANELVLCLIGQGRFAEAMQIIRSEHPDPENRRVQDVFNYAMGEWGATKNMPGELFQRVVELDRQKRLTRPNNNQCVAIAYWAIGDPDEALRRVSEARQEIIIRPRNDFSAWRYLKVSAETFLEDLDAQQEMIKGAGVVPLVFSLRAGEGIELRR